MSISTKYVIRLKGPIVDDDDDKTDGVTARGFAEVLNRAEPGSEVQIEIDGPGGLCRSMDAIIEAAERCKARITTHITGEAYSAYFSIAMMGHHRAIAPSGWMMLHGASVGGFKHLKGCREWNDKIANYIHRRTGIRKALLAEWMRDEKYFNAQEALNYGLVHEIRGDLAKVTVPEVPEHIRLDRELQSMKIDLEILRRTREIRDRMRFDREIDDILRRSRGQSPLSSRATGKRQPVALPPIPTNSRIIVSATQLSPRHPVASTRRETLEDRVFEKLFE